MVVVDVDVGFVFFFCANDRLMVDLQLLEIGGSRLEDLEKEKLSHISYLGTQLVKRKPRLSLA